MWCKWSTSSCKECELEPADDACLSHAGDGVVFCGAHGAAPFADLLGWSAASVAQESWLLQSSQGCSGDWLMLLSLASNSIVYAVYKMIFWTLLALCSSFDIVYSSNDRMIVLQCHIQYIHMHTNICC